MTIKSIALLALAASSALAAPSKVNLISNGGFEAQIAGYADSWAFQLQSGQVSFSDVENKAHAFKGKYAMQYTSSTNGSSLYSFASQVSVTEGANYTLNAHIGYVAPAAAAAQLATATFAIEQYNSYSSGSAVTTSGAVCTKCVANGKAHYAKHSLTFTATTSTVDFFIAHNFPTAGDYTLLLDTVTLFAD